MSPDLLLLGGALLSGLMGSGHCALMCGGIATGFAARSGGRSGWPEAMELNLGRVAGYTLAGALAGGLGHAIVAVAQLPALTLVARAAAGLALITAALRLYDRRGRLAFLRAPQFLWQRWFAPWQHRVSRLDGGLRRLLGGMLWGWLPCGLSATVLLAAWLQSSAAAGAMSMLAFGLGTLPTMVPLTWSGARLGQKLQSGGARLGVATLILLAGLTTLLAPWLARVPQLHHALSALGCRSIS